MSKPRTPEHFPRMKVRGYRRHRNAQITHAWRSASRIDWAGVHDALAQVGRSAAVAVEQLADFGNTMRVSMLRAMNVGLWLAQRAVRNRWVATHQLTATVSPYAAPMVRVEGVHEYGHGIVVRGQILGDVTQIPGYRG